MKTLANLIKALLIFVLMLALVFFMGPRTERPDLSTDLPALEYGIDEVAERISRTESAVENVRPGNEAQIVWADSVGVRTPYSIVYLHGWSASRRGRILM